MDFQCQQSVSRVFLYGKRLNNSDLRAIWEGERLTNMYSLTSNLYDGTGGTGDSSRSDNRKGEE